MNDHLAPDDTINGMPVLGVCRRCGRGFLTIGSKVDPANWRDPYGVIRRKGFGYEPCDGQIRLTAAGSAAIRAREPSP